jgi:hypothetical protein
MLNQCSIHPNDIEYKLMFFVSLPMNTNRIQFETNRLFLSAVLFIKLFSVSVIAIILSELTGDKN